MLAFLFSLLLPLHAANITSLTTSWQLAFGEHVDSCPAIDSDGNIYATASGNIGFMDVSGGKLACVTPDGRKRWTFPTRCDIRSSPAIGDDGTIYFGARDRKLYAITPAGKLKWSFATGAWVDASPAIGTNEIVYFGSWDQKFYAVNPDGTKRWEFATDGPIDSSATIANDGTIYFGSHDKKFYALKPDGSVKWSFATQGAIISSPALNCDGTIYFTSVDGKLYALNPDGAKKWELWTGGVHASSPVLGAEGNIYLGVNDQFQALKSDGTKLGWFGYPMIDGSAAVAADGTVYVAGNDNGVGVVYGFDSKADLKTYSSLNGYVTSSLALARDGTIYVGGYKLQALKGTGRLAKSCWPKFRGGPRQTGRMEQ